LSTSPAYVSKAFIAVGRGVLDDRLVVADSGLSWQRTLPTSAPLRFALVGFLIPKDMSEKLTEYKDDDG